MKLIYSVLKNQFLPDLSVNAKTLANDLAMIGHFVSAIDQIEGETILDLEIRQNRGDCLGYYGLARDLSILYNLEIASSLIAPRNDVIASAAKQSYYLPITITSSDVKRIQAVRISKIKNSTSPDWLVNFLKLHQVNPINLVVDLTNYIMFLWGIPNHAFIDTNQLVWENNQKYSQITTLDGTVLKLPPQTLIISDQKEALSLSFLGGQSCAIKLDTTDIIIEVAIYNRSRVKTDSRALKTTTEAEIRLDKELDPELIPPALNHLASLISELTGGQISSQLFDYYPNPSPPPKIDFNPQLPSLISGIDIPQSFALDIVKKVGHRQDLNIPEDLAEEVIRFWGYQKIPVSLPLAPKQLPDITPKILYLAQKLRDDLTAQGYDEVRSWPLVQKPINQNAIKTQNSINSEYPYLRQSIIQSLQKQLDSYQRFKLPQPKFFEIGKIFYQENGQYTEKYALGTYDGQQFKEIILDDSQAPDSYTPATSNSQAIELTSQIITLDANVISSDNPEEILKKYQQLIDPKILWSIIIADHYQNKYTLRVSYYNCNDKTAKKVHLSAFGLTDKQYQYIDPQTETKLLYYTDMYQTETTATVINIKTINSQKYLILDQTIFFPEGGGQPADLGTINNHQVIDLKYKNNQTLHQINNTTKLEIGDIVSLKIDWGHRYQYMKIHSAGHLLHEVLMEINHDLIPLEGYHHNNAYLIYSGQIDPKKITEIETKFNQLVDQNLNILCDYTDIATLKKDARLIPSNLPVNKKLRRLKIGRFPSMADGGIQVKSTAEIGQIKIISVDNSNNQAKITYQLV